MKLNKFSFRTSLIHSHLTLSAPLHTQIQLQVTNNNMTTIVQRFESRHSQLLCLEMYSTKASWDKQIVERGAMWYLGQLCSYFQPLICLSTEKKRLPIHHGNLHSAVLAHCSKLSVLYLPSKSF